MYATSFRQNTLKVLWLFSPRAIGDSITFLLTLAIVSACLLSSDSATAAQGGSPNNYSTKFALAENSISENGKWLSGKTVGLDWSNIQTSPGLAIGTQDGNGNHDDSVAVLSGKWASDQTVEATPTCKIGLACRRLDFSSERVLLHTTSQGTRLASASATATACRFSAGMDRLTIRSL